MKAIASKLFRAAGYEVRKSSDNLARSDYSETEREILRKVKPFTMTSVERLVSVIDSTTYISRSGIQGPVVECGVWRGGSTMAAALTLLSIGDLRDIYLFDTFEGMSEPTPEDGDYARSKFDKLRVGNGSKWCDASLEEVRNNVASTGYPMDRVHLIKGKVEDTIPAHAPENIALLRLDTDWYESTKHELLHLYPRLRSQGVLIIDDYGNWSGARKAVDEYVALHRVPLLMHRSDYTGRVALKP